MQRCSAAIDFLDKDRPFFPVTVNNKDLHEHYLSVTRDMLGTHNVKDVQPKMGAEDFAFYTDVIPAYYYFVGMQNESHGPLPSGHSPFFTVNEDVLPYGAALQASLATRYLLEFHDPSPSLEGKVHDEL